MKKLVIQYLVSIVSIIVAFLFILILISLLFADTEPIYYILARLLLWLCIIITIVVLTIFVKRQLFDRGESK